MTFLPIFMQVIIPVPVPLRERVKFRNLILFLILRCERSEPRRMQARAPELHPSRLATLAPQDEERQASFIVLAAQFFARAMPSQSNNKSQNSIFVR
jgi:hypothetical protein